MIYAFTNNWKWEEVEKGGACPKALWCLNHPEKFKGQFHTVETKNWLIICIWKNYLPQHNYMAKGYFVTMIWSFLFLLLWFGDFLFCDFVKETSVWLCYGTILCLWCDLEFCSLWFKISWRVLVIFKT